MSGHSAEKDVDPWACPHDWAPGTHCRFCGIPAPEARVTSPVEGRDS